MTLKHGQGNQTWHELVDPKQGYNNAKLERPALKQCLQRSQLVKFCQIIKRQLPPLNMCKSEK